MLILFNKKCERIHFLSQFLWMKGWNIIPKSMVLINMELNLPDIALSTQAFSLGSWLRLRLHLKTKAGSRLWNKSDSRSFSEGCFFFSTVSGFFWQNYRFCSLQRSSICRGQGFCPQYSSHLSRFHNRAFHICNAITELSVKFNPETIDDTGTQTAIRQSVPINAGRNFKLDIVQVHIVRIKGNPHYVLTLCEVDIFDCHSCPCLPSSGVGEIDGAGYIYTVHLYMQCLPVTLSGYTQVKIVCSSGSNVNRVFQPFAITNVADIILPGVVGGVFNIDIIISECGISLISIGICLMESLPFTTIIILFCLDSPRDLMRIFLVRGFEAAEEWLSLSRPVWLQLRIQSTLHEPC